MKIFAKRDKYMDNNTLRNHITKILDLPEEDLSLLISCVTYRELKKGEILLNEGEISLAFYLVKNGYLRTYFNKGTTVINLHFAFEGEFTANLQGIKTRQGSENIIAAGEDSSVWIFDLNVIAKYFDTRHQINIFMRRMAFRMLLAMEEHGNLFKIYTPTERYRYIEKNNPRLLQRISLSQIASYLGIARETLSRIRAKVD
ncbi:MAG: Crp/Fnr family transcriptional regulator [Bacteroidota bacterium]|nr:Crp/Fnr family transcriptional regulator [Bacteroidota bacterium]